MTQNSFAVGGLTADHEEGPDAFVIRPAVGLVRLLFAMTQNSFDVGGLTTDHEVGRDAVAFRDVGRMAVALLSTSAAVVLVRPYCIGDVRGGHQRSGQAHEPG